MKQRKSVLMISALVLIISAVLTVGGCRSATGSGVVHVTSVSLNIMAHAFMNDGNYELQLEAKVLPENATNKNVTWKSSNERRITVDQTGKVTYHRLNEGDGPENIDVTVTTEDGGYTSTCTLSVLDDL
jgi:Ig domain protein group 2 domain protein